MAKPENSSSYLHVEGDFAVFIGSFSGNRMHRHYASQLSIGLGPLLELEDEQGQVQTAQNFFIPGLRPHRLACPGPQLLILMNPASRAGHRFSHMIPGQISPLSHSGVERLLEIGKEVLSGQMGFAASLSPIRKATDFLSCECPGGTPEPDPRIKTAMEYLSHTANRVVSLAELAGQVHLSAERFRHLFRAETGITLRRAQLWKRTVLALQELGKRSLTEIAHHHGFSDSAHFSRTVTENFGFSPRTLAAL